VQCRDCRIHPLKELLGKTAKLDFRLVDLSCPTANAEGFRPGPDSEILYGTKSEGMRAYLIVKRVAVSGGTSPSKAETDQQKGQWS